MRSRPRFAWLPSILAIILATPVSAQRAFPVNEDGEYPASTWNHVAEPEALGWSSEMLARARAFADSIGSAGVMVVDDGWVIASWGEVAKPYRTHSTRKAMLSSLYGIYAAQSMIDISATLGDLGIDEPATPLTKAEKRATVEDLLKSRSGVYLPAAAELPSMREARPERGSHAPGTHFYYNNWSFNVLGTIFRLKTGEDLFEAFGRRVAGPIGMEDYSPAHGRYVLEKYSAHPAYPFRISVRDLARFGLLYLRDGRWRGVQVVPEDWVRRSTRSYSDAGQLGTKSGFGYTFRVAVRTERYPELGIPEGTFGASGLGGNQRLAVVPQLKLVVSHMVDTDDREGPRVDNEQFDRLLSLILSAKQR